MCVCLIDTMENLVKADKKEEWPQARAKWFVEDENDARDLRFPGKMKEEWSTTNGAIIW